MWAAFQESFWLRRPFVVATWAYAIYYANKFDDTKFVAVLSSVIAVFVIDFLGRRGELKEIVAKGLDTVTKLRGKEPSGND